MAAGSTAITPTLLSLLQSCQQTERENWQPVFLTKDHSFLITSLVDTILPKTNTPGGLDVKVDVFIDLVFKKLYDDQGQKSVVISMDEFNSNCKNKFGENFNDLDEKQRAEILSKQELSSPKYNGQVWGTAVGDQQPVGFYRSLKSLMLWGYFSTEEIGKNVLNYDPIPGEYSGCVPVKEIGNAWSS